MTRAFVSYARSDGSCAADVVERELEAGGFVVWRDLRDIDPFADFSVEIERAISVADVVVVCVTPSIAGAEASFVRREINYALGKGKRLVPILIGDVSMPVQINHLTWIKAERVEDLSGTLAFEMRRRLALPQPTDLGVSRGGPHSLVGFARALIDDIVNHLENSALTLLDIDAVGTFKAESLGALPPTIRLLRPMRKDRVLKPGEIGQSMVARRHRVLLRGAPGSGKTTSLLIAAREGAHAWLETNSGRLPVVAQAADWNASKGENILDWLARATSILPKAELRTLLESGRLALFIDGLDELPAQIVVNPKEVVCPRKALLEAIPPDVSALVTSRSAAVDELGDKHGFRILDVAPIRAEQIARYIEHDANLAALLGREPAFRDLLETPLTLGLLSFVAAAQDGQGIHGPDVGALPPRLRIVNDFIVGRWHHEQKERPKQASLEAFLTVFGRVANRRVRNIDADTLAEVGRLDASRALAELQTATLLGLVAPAPDGRFLFFHPSFAEYFATVHCRRYLGHDSADGWDDALFEQVAALGDRTFIPKLVAMAERGGFWPGEFCDQIAVALSALGTSDDVCWRRLKMPQNPPPKMPQHPAAGTPPPAATEGAEGESATTRRAVIPRSELGAPCDA